MKKNEKLREIIKDKLITPEDGMLGKFRLEIFERGSVYVYGCRRILEYSQERILLSLRGDAVEIDGEGLVPTFFHDGVVLVRGELSGVKFLHEEGER